MLAPLVLLVLVTLGGWVGWFKWADILPLYVLAALGTLAVLGLRTLMPRTMPLLDGLFLMRLLWRVSPGLRLLHALHAGLRTQAEIARAYALPSVQFDVLVQRLGQAGLLTEHARPGKPPAFELTPLGQQRTRELAGGMGWNILDSVTAVYVEYA